MAGRNHKSKIRPDNRPWHLFIEGKLAGMFHSERQAKAARTAVKKSKGNLSGQVANTKINKPI